MPVAGRQTLCQKTVHVFHQQPAEAAGHPLRLDERTLLPTRTLHMAPGFGREATSLLQHNQGCNPSPPPPEEGQRPDQTELFHAVTISILCLPPPTRTPRGQAQGPGADPALRPESGPGPGRPWGLA